MHVIVGKPRISPSLGTTPKHKIAWSEVATDTPLWLLLDGIGDVMFDTRRAATPKNSRAMPGWRNVRGKGGGERARAPSPRILYAHRCVPGVREEVRVRQGSCNYLLTITVLFDIFPMASRARLK